MTKKIIAFDLGTGGNKAALYDIEGKCLAENFAAYPTLYPKAGWHEQRPNDWWSAVIQSTRALLAQAQVDKNEIEALGISGHSLGVIPLDGNNRLLRESTPIWSDSRPVEQARRFFEKISETDWYNLTGNGFPAPLYSVFKIMWYRDQEPDMFRQISRVIGTKDYINLRLTGRTATDFSYASGSGVYDLVAWEYSDRLIEASGLPGEIFPEILPSAEVIGTLTRQAAEELGLTTRVKVVTGGVDNSCMALGARNIKDGRIYNSQGSSSWIAVTTRVPILDEHFRPFVFTAVIPELFNSAIPVFSSGSSFRWVRDQICPDLVAQAKTEGGDVYDLMTALAAKSPVGARGILFNPNLAGGSSIDKSINIRGAFIGLDLGHTRADIIRATMEGVAMEMRMALDDLRKKMKVSEEMVVVGGGSRSKLWRQIYADVFGMRIIKTNIDQQAAALGAAALAAVGAGYWKDYEIIDRIHQVEDVTNPDLANVQEYERIMPIFYKLGNYLAEIGDDLTALNLSNTK